MANTFNATGLQCNEDTQPTLGALDLVIYTYNDKPFTTLDPFTTTTQGGRTLTGFATTGVDAPVIDLIKENLKQKKYLKVTTNAAAQLIDYTTTIDLSQEFYTGEDSPFINLAVGIGTLNTGAVIPALTQAQRTIRVALVDTDGVPHIYSDSLTPIGGLTPTVAIPELKIIIGDPTLANQDMTNYAQNIKIDMSKIFEIGTNQTQSKKFSRMVVMMSLPTDIQVGFLASKIYQSTDDFCPDVKSTFIELPEEFNLAVKQNKDLVNDNPQKLIKGIVDRITDYMVEKIQIPLSFRILRRIYGLKAFTAKDSAEYIYKKVTIDAGVIANGFTDSEITNNVKSQSDVAFGYFEVDGNKYDIATTSGTPVKGEVAVIRTVVATVPTTRFVFSNDDLGKVVTIVIKNSVEADQYIDFGLPNILPTARVDFAVRLSDNQDKDSATTLSKIYSLNRSFSLSSDLQIGSVTNAKEAKMTINLEHLSKNSKDVDLRFVTKRFN
jgi:hypothetical protein